MSRHIVSNSQSLNNVTSLIFSARPTDDHRHIICIEYSSDAHPPYESAFTQADICFVPANSRSDRADRITHLLGREHEILVHPISDPMDAGLLAALAGTLKADGILLLLMPSRQTLERDTALNEISRFGQRFRRLISHHEAKSPQSVHCVTLQTAEISLSEIVTSLINASQQFANKLTKKCDKERTAALQQQDQLLSEACDFLQNNAKGCITVTGKRGRGKSTLLARIANWLQTQNLEFAVSAANRSALHSFYKHVGTSPTVHPNPESIDNTLAPILLVDEAGNLPVHVLIKLLANHERVVFCTTVEGYETAGRAFDVRFIDSIKTASVPWLNVTPTLSWRWGPNDPLEQLLSVLILDHPSQNQTAQQAGVGSNPARPINNTTVQEISQQALADDENTLAAVFHLLRETHYQTTIQDLQHLLDGEQVRLWQLTIGEENALAGVLLVGMEGCIAQELHQAVVDKQRRLPHQLLPQLLAQMAAEGAALDKLYARVIRISIVATLRQRGLGSTLLQSVESQLTDKVSSPIHALGASLAADPISLAFWEANGFIEFHRGFRLNPRTGRHAVAVIKSLNKSVHEVVQQAAHIHQDNQLWRHAHAHAHAQAQAQAQALEDTPTMNTRTSMTQSFDKFETTDKPLLEQFISGQRSAHDCYAALSRLAARQLITFPAIGTNSQRSQDADLRNQVLRILDGQ